MLVCLHPTHYIFDLDAEIVPTKESAALRYPQESSVSADGPGDLPGDTVVTAPALVPAAHQVGLRPSALYIIHVELPVLPEP